MALFTKILFPCDLTENVEKIVPYVRVMAEKFGASVIVFHAVDDLKAWGITYIPYTRIQELVQDALDSADAMLEKVLAEHFDEGPSASKKIVSGDPVKEILHEIEADDIDLVIMGTHARQSLANDLFGSVTEKVIRQSPVPMMLINPHAALSS